MKKPSPALTTTGPKGELWGYDPTTQKWSIEFEGNKSTSMKRESLEEKLRSWTKKTLTAETRDIPMLDLQWKNGALVSRVVSVRAAWDVENNRATIDKYHSGEGRTSWRVWGSNDLNLIDPYTISPQVNAILVQSMRLSHAQDRALQAKKDIAKAWVEAMEDLTQSILVEREGTFQQINSEALKEHTKYQGFGRRPSLYPIPQSMTPVTVLPEADTEGWDIQDGKWVKGDVRVGLVAGGFSGPQFIVEVKGLEGREEFARVYECEEGNKALQVAQATLEVLSGTPQSAQLFRGSEGWEHSNLNNYNWPKPVDVLGTALLLNPVSAIQSRDIHQLMCLEKEAGSDDGSQWKWATISPSGYGSPSRYWNRTSHHPGAEAVGEIDSAVKTISAEQTGLKKFQEVFESNTQEALNQAWARIDDGDEPLEAPQILARWAREESRIKKNLAQDEAIVSLEKRLDELVERTKEKLAAKPKSRGPRV